MGYLDLRVSFGGRLEDIDLRRASRSGRPCQSDVLVPDCRGGDLRLAVTPWADGPQGYLDLLADCGGHALAVVPEIEGQRLFVGARQEGLGLLSVGVSVRR